MQYCGLARGCKGWARPTKIVVSAGRRPRWLACLNPGTGGWLRRNTISMSSSSGLAMPAARRRWPLPRMGAKTALLTMNLDTIGQMSCNPAIGGVAKGQIVREIDALGGEMGRVIDETGIQFRMLNRTKGPAMHSPRAQADKKAYQFAMKLRVEEQAESRRAARDGRRAGDGRGANRRRAGAGRRRLSGAGRHHHDGHLPAGAHAHGRSQDRRRHGLARGRPTPSRRVSPSLASSCVDSRRERPAG